MLNIKEGNKNWRLVVTIMLFVSTLMGLIAPSMAIAQQNGPTPIIVFGDSNLPPYEFLEGDTPRGANVDLWAAIGSALNRPVKVQLMKWSEAQEWVLSGKGHALTLMSRNEEREKVYDFTDSTLLITFSYFARVGETKAFPTSSLGEKKIGVTKGGFPIIWLKSNRPDAELVIVKDHLDGFRKLLRGEVDAVALVTWTGYYILRENGIESIQAVSLPFANKHVGIPVPKGNPALVGELNRAIQEIKQNGELDLIMDKWSGKKIILLDRQQVWNIATAEVLVFILIISTIVIALTLRSRNKARHITSLLRDNNTKLQNEIIERNLSDLNLRKSERRFRDFAEASADWLWETDEEHRFSFISEGFTHATTGLMAKSILGKKRTDFAKEDMQLYPEKWKKHLAELDAHRAIKDFQYSVITPQEGMRVFAINGKPAFDADGTFKGYRGVARNITQLKKSEENLNVERKRAETIIEMAPLAIVTIDQQLNIIAFNRSAEETFGYTRDEALGKSLHMLLVGDMADRHDDLIRKFSTKNLKIHRMNKHGDIKGLRKNGEVFLAEGSVSKQETENGITFTAMLTDVTERKHAEQELIHHREHLEELIEQGTTEIQEKAAQLEAALEREKEYNTLQKRFVALVSHEFRTPLAIIDSTAQRLIRRKDKLDTDEIEIRADKVRSAVSRMVGLIDTTLYASQMDDGNIEMNCTLGDIGELILDVCERQAEISPDHQCNADVEKLPNEMWFDPNLLDHVFTNLLSNAVKYSPQAPHIEIKGWQENEGIVVSVVTVTDHGVGIPKDDLPHMFGRFFRASTAVGIKGTGLGLSVCKEFVEMHGGSIGVTSEEGEGTTFTVRLPVITQDHKNFGSGI